MFLTHIVLPCNPDETGRPLPPNERLQCLADGEHSIAHHIYPIKVILTYLSHNFASSLAIPLLCTLLHFHNPENFPIDAAFSFGSADLTRFQRASCVLIPSGLSLPPYLINSLWDIRPPKGWILSQILILVYFYIDSGVHTCGIDFHFDNPNAGDEERPRQLARVPTYQVCLCAQHN